MFVSFCSARRCVILSRADGEGSPETTIIAAEILRCAQDDTADRVRDALDPRSE